MAIDDHPFDASEKQFKLEDSSLSPVTKILLNLAMLISWPWPFDKAFSYLRDRSGADPAQRAKVMLEACMNEVRKHDAEISEIKKNLSGGAAKAREDATADLVVDATRKAVNTRSLKRVERIGIILANGVVQKTLHSDRIEEMMRIAMELDDVDLRYLAELVRIEGDTVSASGRVTRHRAYTAWESGTWGNGTDPELDSVFSKLASYGLVVQIPPPNNLNIMADFQNRYALLPKGLHFCALVTAA